MSMLRYRYFKTKSNVFDVTNLKRSSLLEWHLYFKGHPIAKNKNKGNGPLYFYVNHSQYGIPLLPFVRLPLRHYCLKLNTLHYWN